MRQLKITKKLTNRTGSFEKYLSDVSKEEMISSEREAELAKLIKKGDSSALNELIRANLRFVISVAKQYQNQGLSLSDLVNEGNMGLIKAAQRFDETKGFKFISYAVWWIRQCILKALAEDGRTIRLPLNKIGRINKIKRISARLEQELERDPLPHEIAEVLEIEEIPYLLELSEKQYSISSMYNNYESDNDVLDFLSKDENTLPDKKLMDESIKQDIDDTINTLTEKESVVLKLFFGLDGRGEKNLEEIGKELNLTCERTRQIKDKALKRLRRNPKRARKLIKHI